MNEKITDIINWVRAYIGLAFFGGWGIWSEKMYSFPFTDFSGYIIRLFTGGLI